MADHDGGGSGGALQSAPEQEAEASQPDTQSGAPPALPLDPVAQSSVIIANKDAAADMPGSSAEDDTACMSDRTASYSSARSEGLTSAS